MKLLAYLWSRFRMVIRDSDGDPYLVRYRLLSLPWFAIYLHHILRSDADRELHDHPWDFTSVILWGSYREHRIGSGTPRSANTPWVEERGWMSIARRNAEDLHRLELSQPAWTLMFVSPKRREWGFLTDEGWVHWAEYIARRCPTPVPPASPPPPGLESLADGPLYTDQGYWNYDDDEDHSELR